MKLALLFAVALAPVDPTGPVPSSWSGVWEDVGGQHRCAVVSEKSLVVVCALGDDAVHINAATNPDQLTEIPAVVRSTDFGTATGADLPWGTISFHAYCDGAQPRLRANLIRYPAQATTSAIADMRPLTQVSACDTGSEG